MMTIAIGFFVINSYVAQYGQSAVAGYGAALRIEQIVLLPTIALNMATLTLVGQSAGANNFDRLQETVRTAFRYMVLAMGTGTILMLFIPEPLMSFFSDDPEIIAQGVGYLRVAGFITVAYGTIHLLAGSLQGMKYPMFALYIGFFRQGIVPITLFPLFTSYLDLDGVWWGIFTASWISAAITFWYHRRVLRTKLASVTESAPSE